MKYQSVFERYEIKYLISKEQQIQIKKEMEPYMIGDSYGKIPYLIFILIHQIMY